MDRRSRKLMRWYALDIPGQPNRERRGQDGEPWSGVQVLENPQPITRICNASATRAQIPHRANSEKNTLEKTAASLQGYQRHGNYGKVHWPVGSK